LGGISIAGRFVVGTGTDKIGGRRALVGCFVFLVAGLLWLQFAREAWMLYLFAVLNGFAHGGFFTVISPTIAELFGLRAHGAIFGIIVFTGTIGSALGPLFAGYMFDLTQTYDIVFKVLAASAVVGLGLSLFVRPVEVHQVAH
ncbi:MAG: MFS transporter, partial [Chloroflexota bacterium]